MAHLHSSPMQMEHVVSQVHTEVIPGTKIMTDVQGSHFVHAHNSASSTVLVPQPTEDIHDPLNWSRFWKMIILINQGSFVIISVVTGLSVAPLTPIYMAEWKKSLTQVALLTGATVISLGYANFIIIPCADIFGRRIVSIICALVCLGANIWQASAQSYDSFLGARVFAGLGAAANESIMTVVVADIFFLHQRGKYVGLYFCCYFMGLFLGPIISGSVGAHVSWRWFFWACTIAQGINLATLLFLFPETRRTAEQVKPLKAQEVPSETNVDSNFEGKSEESPAHVESAASNLFTEEGIATDPCLGRGYPSKGQFSIFQPSNGKALGATILHVIIPVQLLFYPIVFWAAMSMGAAANALLVVNLIQSQALAAPPYSFNPAFVGYANFALVVGGMIALIVAGPFSDFVAMRATKKNHGIREPEMRLPALIPFVAAALIGLVVVGVGFQRGWPWEAVIIIGFGLVGVQVVAIPTIAVTYAIDCYEPVAGQIMVISTVCKNTFGFGMTYYINNWAVSNGFIPPLLLLMAMTVGFSLAGIVVFMIFGKGLRRRTRNSKVHSL